MKVLFFFLSFFTSHTAANRPFWCSQGAWPRQCAKQRPLRGILFHVHYFNTAKLDRKKAHSLHHLNTKTGWSDISVKYIGGACSQHIPTHKYVESWLAILIPKQSNLLLLCCPHSQATSSCTQRFWTISQISHTERTNNNPRATAHEPQNSIHLFKQSWFSHKWMMIGQNFASQPLVTFLGAQFTKQYQRGCLPSHSWQYQAAGVLATEAQHQATNRSQSSIQDRR